MKTLIIAKHLCAQKTVQSLGGRTRTAIGRYWSATGAKLDRFKEVDTSWTLQFVGNWATRGKSRLPWLAHYTTAPLPGRKTRTNVRWQWKSGDLRFPIADIESTNRISREIRTFRCSSNGKYRTSFIMRKSENGCLFSRQVLHFQ